MNREEVNPEKKSTNDKKEEEGKSCCDAYVHLWADRRAVATAVVKQRTACVAHRDSNE